LGLQVHDVGGRQVSPRGDRREPPASSPALRTTRDLEPGHVVTIEPGLYFIPMLLEPFRSGAAAAAFDWPLIDALAPCGGIRIEDDILVTDGGREDLTRPVVPGHRDH
jgi:Xaa-Pro dipeptidase